MTSLVTRIGSTTASANSSQLTVSTQSNVSAINSTIVSAVAPAFATLSSQQASDGLKSNLYLQATLKVSSEIDTLVELGKTGGTPQVTKEQTRSYISQKIRTLKESAKSPVNLPSVRSDLCKLSRISSAHYPDLKEEVFNLLLHLIEEDPITPQTAHGILEMVIDLNSDLALLNAQILSILFQKKLARVFSASVELFLRHYNKKDHVNGVNELQKLALLETQSNFSGLNTKENLSIEFYSQMALEASKRLTSDKTFFTEIFERLSHFAASLGKAYNTDLGAFFSELGQVFQGLDNKIKEKWFEGLFMLREVVQKAPDNMKKVITIQVLLETKKEGYDWKFIYGALEILGEIVSQTEDIKVLDAALFGQSVTKIDMPASSTLKMAKASMALGAAATKRVTPKVCGIYEFLKFTGYSKTARIATKNDKKADNAIQAKSKELCLLIAQKMSKAYEGRKLLLYRFQTAEIRQKAKNEDPLFQILGTVIPAHQKYHKTWLGSPTSISRNEQIRFSRSDEIDLKSNHSATLIEASDSGLEPKSIFHQAVIRGKFDIVQNQISLKKDVVNIKDSDGNTPLILAAREGHTQICEMLMKAGASPITRGENFRNAFHNAAAAGKMQIMKLFAAEKVLLNSIDESKRTPFMLAAEQGHADICEVLFDMQANMEAADKKGLNALHLAASNGHIDVVNLMILLQKNKIKLDNKDKEGNTALILAANEGHYQVCIALLKAGADPLSTNEYGENAMHFAAYDGKVELVKMLLVHKQLIDSKTKEGSTPLICSAKGESHSEVCEVLLKAGADPLLKNEDGWNAMHLAVLAGNSEIVKMLCVHKQLIDSQIKEGKTPLMLAAREGDLKVFDVLLKAGADLRKIDQDGWNAMHLAAINGHTEIVKILSAHKQLIDSKIKLGQTPLLLATEEGHLETCEVLLKAGANPLTIYEDDWNAMHLAASEGKTKIVKLLLVHKQLIDSKIKMGHTPLLLAAQKGHLEICEVLLKAGANPLATDENSENAMHSAADEGKIGIVKILSAHKQLVNSKNKNGETPLIFAARDGYLEVFEVLLKAGADPATMSEAGWNAMHFAAFNGNIEIVKILSTYKQLVNSTKKDGQTPLLLAAEQGNLETCKVLLKAGANPLAIDEDGYNAMHLAATEGKGEIVQLLVAYKPLIDSISKIGKTPLIYAAQEGHIEACEVLLKAGASPLINDVDGWNAMHWAAINGKNEIVKILSVQKALIDSKDKKGATPLKFAESFEHLDTYEALLKVGANPPTADEHGMNAMHWAADYGKTEIVKLLLTYTQYIDSKAKNGATPLMIAADQGHVEVCIALMKGGANLTATNEYGESAMHRAAKEGKVEIVRLLSAHKQLVDFKDIDGSTPLMLAAKQGHSVVCEVLLKTGANPLAVDKYGDNAMQLAESTGKSEVVKMLSEYYKRLDAKK